CRLYGFLRGKYQVPRFGITCVRSGRQNFRLLIGRVDRSCHDGTASGLAGPCGVEIMPAVRQKLWPVMAALRFREMSDRFRFPPFCRNALQALRRSKQNGPVAVPRPAVKAGGLADLLGWAARSVHSLQPSLGGECDGTAIRRPE